jgi:very-short-patch-repair endonuclease
VLDLAEAAGTLDEAFFWMARACQRRLTNAGMLLAVLSWRNKMKWRTGITAALHNVHAGAHSPLEWRYLRDVERGHGLPTASRQAKAIQHGRVIYRDALYRRYGVATELDGAANHPAEQRWRDNRRDSAAAADGIITLRYGWADVTEHPCETAREVAEVLRSRGWQGQLRPCGPGCRAV